MRMVSYNVLGMVDLIYEGLDLVDCRYVIRLNYFHRVARDLQHFVCEKEVVSWEIIHHLQGHGAFLYAIAWKVKTRQFLSLYG